MVKSDEIVDTNSARTLSFSTDDIYRGGDSNRCLSDDLNTIEGNITALQNGKADTNHTHSGYLSEDDAVTTFAAINHTHTGYAAADHTHSNLESLIETLDNTKADISHTHADLASANHTHAQSDVTGLVDRLAGIDTAISELQSGSSGSEVQPMVIASMHLGKIDNNNGSEVTSSSRICSEPFAVQNGKSYWQVNDKGVNMYALIYDADEVFLGYLGNFASGAEIAVNNANVAYMRISSLLGEYDLTNIFKIYDVDPSSSGGSSGTTIDAYTKTEADDRFAPVTHSHAGYLTTAEAGEEFAPITHEHAGYAAASHTHSYNDLTDVPTDQGGYVHPDTHPASMITGLATVATSGKYSDLTGKPTTMPANGGDADTVGGKYPSAFATASHTHSTYLPLSGGSLTGNLNVGGIFRVNNQQSVYDDGSMITLSTNNRQTMIAGSKIYSKQTINVSSDERLKENIEFADPEECTEFINSLGVKTFNYIGDDTPCIGVIAQDLQDSEFGKFFVCKQPGEEGYLAVKAADLVFPLIAAVQNLSAEVDYLKAMI